MAKRKNNLGGWGVCVFFFYLTYSNQELMSSFLDGNSDEDQKAVFRKEKKETRTNPMIQKVQLMWLLLLSLASAITSPGHAPDVAIEIVSPLYSQRKWRKRLCHPVKVMRIKRRKSQWPTSPHGQQWVQRFMSHFIHQNPVFKTISHVYIFQQYTSAPSVFSLGIILSIYFCLLHVKLCVCVCVLWFDALVQCEAIHTILNGAINVN